MANDTDIFKTTGAIVDQDIFGAPSRVKFIDPAKTPKARTSHFERQLDPMQDLTGPEQAIVGMGRRVHQIATLGGLYDLPGMPGASASSDYMDANLASSGAATGGSIAADVAISALPIARAQQFASGLVRAAPATTSLLSGGLLSGAYEGLTRPGDLAERGWNAARGAALSMGGETLMRGLGRLFGGPLRGASASPEAADLVREGVPVPPWKAAPEDSLLRRAGEYMKGGWLSKKVMQPLERNATVKWVSNLVRKASAPKPVLDEGGRVIRWELDKPITEVSGDTLNKLRERFNDAFDALYKGRTLPVDDAFRAELDDIVTKGKAWYPTIADDIAALGKRVDDALSVTVAGKETSKIVDATGKAITKQIPGRAGVSEAAMREVRDMVEDQISKQYEPGGNVDKAEVFKAMRDALDSLRERGLPPEVAKMAEPVRKAYQQFIQLQKAYGNIGARISGIVTPRQMVAATKATADKRAFARGNAPNQRGYESAARVLGSELPEVGPGTAEKIRFSSMLTNPFSAASELAQWGLAGGMSTPFGANYLFGLLGPQRAIGQGASAVAPYVGQTTRATNAELLRGK